MTCFISDPIGVRLRHEIGIDNIMWEMDYPHSDSMWPDAPEVLDGVLKAEQVPDDEIDKMTHLNAMRWYNFDPFKYVPRQQATVGALRAAAGTTMSASRRARTTAVPHRRSWRPSNPRSPQPPRRTRADEPAAISARRGSMRPPRPSYVRSGRGRCFIPDVDTPYCCHRGTVESLVR